MRVTRDLDPAGGRRSGAEVLAHLSEDLVVFGRSESDRRGSGGILGELASAKRAWIASMSG